jgi:regulatory protein
VSEELEHALGLAYRYLNRRERTTHEVVSYLERKGLEGALARECAAALTDQGYLDDGRFVRLFIQDKRNLEQWGAERIRRSLLARGIDPEPIATALDEIEGESELDRAVDLLVRRFPSPPNDRRERDRALGVLIRKGYDPELALDALAAYKRSAA